MIGFADTLRAGHILLDLNAPSVEVAAEALTGLLKKDERVLDWALLKKTLLTAPHCKVDDAAEFGICIMHARTGAVGEMLVAAARLAPESEFTMGAKPIRYVFCVAVPKELAADYLRLAGALMRIFSDEAVENSLHAAKSGRIFIEALKELERKL